MRENSDILLDQKLQWIVALSEKKKKRDMEWVLESGFQ